MIRKVPNISAWILKASDVNWFLPISTIHVGFVYSAKLPLFSTTPLVTRCYGTCQYEDDELILLIDGYELFKSNVVFGLGVMRGFTLEEVEEINKTWNKFYV